MKFLKLTHPFRSPHFQVIFLLPTKDYNRSGMAATVSCSTTHVVHNAPVAVISKQSTIATSSRSFLHFRTQFRSVKLAATSSDNVREQSTTSSRSFLQFRRQFRSVKLAATNNSEGNVRELASEKAVESGQQVADDSSKLAGRDDESAGAFDAKVEDASDAASYDSNVRESVVDVASDVAVDNTEDVDEVARKDAEPLAQESGRSVEDATEALGSKAVEVSDREARKET